INVFGARRGSVPEALARTRNVALPHSMKSSLPRCVRSKYPLYEHRTGSKQVSKKPRAVPPNPARHLPIAADLFLGRHGNPMYHAQVPTKPFPVKDLISQPALVRGIKPGTTAFAIGIRTYGACLVNPAHEQLIGNLVDFTSQRHLGKQ